MKEIITYEDLITASNAYPERLHSTELTIDIKENAKLLLEKVNSLLRELNIAKVKVSSGFRPSNVNSQIANAAKKSAHMICQAVDIIDDKDQTLGKLITSHPEKLRELGLFVEDLGSTKGKNSNWCHIDMVKRSDRPSRTFKP